MRPHIGVLGPVAATLALSLAAQSDGAQAPQARSQGRPTFVRANAWVAMPVLQRSEDGEKRDMGRITGLVLNRQTGRIEVAAVHLSRPLDGEDIRVVEVPMEKLKLDAEQGSFLCILTPAQLLDLESFQPARYRLGGPEDDAGAAEASTPAAAEPPVLVLVHEIEGLQAHGKDDAVLGLIPRLDLETGSGTVAFAELQTSEGTRHLVPWAALRLDDRGETPRLHIEIDADRLGEAPMADEQVLADPEKRRSVYEFFQVPLPEYERKSEAGDTGR